MPTGPNVWIFPLHGAHLSTRLLILHHNYLVCQGYQLFLATQPFLVQSAPVATQFNGSRKRTRTSTAKRTTESDKLVLAAPWPILI